MFLEGTGPVLQDGGGTCTSKINQDSRLVGLDFAFPDGISGQELGEIGERFALKTGSMEVELNGDRFSAFGSSEPTPLSFSLDSQGRVVMESGDKEVIVSHNPNHLSNVSAAFNINCPGVIVPDSVDSQSTVVVPSATPVSFEVPKPESWSTEGYLTLTVITLLGAGVVYRAARHMIRNIKYKYPKQNPSGAVQVDGAELPTPSERNRAVRQKGSIPSEALRPLPKNKKNDGLFYDDADN